MNFFLDIKNSKFWYQESAIFSYQKMNNFSTFINSEVAVLNIHVLDKHMLDI